MVINHSITHLSEFRGVGRGLWMDGGKGGMQRSRKEEEHIKLKRTERRRKVSAGFYLKPENLVFVDFISVLISETQQCFFTFS